jgi:hypothetical protein
VNVDKVLHSPRALLLAISLHCVLRAVCCVLVLRTTSAACCVAFNAPNTQAVITTNIVKLIREALPGKALRGLVIFIEGFFFEETKEISIRITHQRYAGTIFEGRRRMAGTAAKIESGKKIMDKMQEPTPCIKIE